MAPTANTKQRRGRGAATTADSDSDIEYQAYNGRLREASAARARLKKAQENRNQKRAALSAAHSAAIARVEARLRSSIAKHHALRSAIILSHLNRLREALQRRDSILTQIANKVAAQRRRMLNLGIQLSTLYEGRKEDIKGLIAELNGEKDPDTEEQELIRG